MELINWLGLIRDPSPGSRPSDELGLLPSRGHGELPADAPTALAAMAGRTM